MREFPDGAPVEVEHPPAGVPAPWRSDWVWSPATIVRRTPPYWWVVEVDLGEGTVERVCPESEIRAVP